MKYLAPVISLALTLAATTVTASELKVGDPAPDFSLPATDGKTYKLSDFKNKETVVLAWFPKAYTSGCTIECKSLAKNGHLIRKYQASYFMISTDPLETNKSFGAEQGADFPLLSDPTKATANAYGVLGVFGVPNRCTYYIGADGKIVAIDKGINPATSAEDMAAMLGKLGTPARN
jgi:peroxiredoxin Q/BCP